MIIVDINDTQFRIYLDDTEIFLDLNIQIM